MIKSFFSLYYKLFRSPIDYARYIGVKVGENTFIDTRNWSTEPYLVTIGNNVQVTAGVRFHTHGGAHVARKQIPGFDTFGKIIVEDWVYIGAGSQIMPGVTIGEGALVAAGSIVTKSVAPHTVVGGNPAKFICTVKEYIEKNKQYNLGTKGLSRKEKKQVILNTEPDRLLNK